MKFPENLYFRNCSLFRLLAHGTHDTRKMLLYRKLICLCKWEHLEFATLFNLLDALDDNKVKLSAMYKFKYLRLTLKRHAFKAIRSFQVTRNNNSNVSNALWKKLKRTHLIAEAS